MHALMGGLAAEAVGGDFRTGALAAGVNEALVNSLAKQYASLPIDDKKGLLIMSSQLIGVLAASTQGDADAKSLQTGAWVAGNATQHNYLSHWQEEKKRQEVDGCKDKQLCKTGIEAKWAIISAQQDVGIVVGVGGGIGLSTAETAVGVYELVKNWRETYAALEQLATSPEFRQQFGDNYLKGLEERAAFLTQAYEDAGWQGSVTAGVEGGRFAAELVGVLTAVKGGAQITAKLPTAAKNLVNAIAESPVSGSMSSQLGAVGDLGRLGGGGKGYVDILSHEAKQHILYGDKPGSGGHLWPGQAGKTVFPQNWSADKIVHEVGDIATSPSTKWYAQTGTGGVYTSKGDPAKWVAYEVRDGVRMRVVYQPATGKVITAFPDNAPIPPYKPIK
nr:EndoU domain-containing protein [Pseudomonas aeruginosa]